MKIHPEQPALDAVNELTIGEKRYPYAASMLIYLIIERELKDYVTEHRRDFIEKKLLSKPTVYCKDLTEKGFTNVVEHMTLGSLETLIGIKEPPTKPSTNRNALMHSKGYKEWQSKDSKKRHKKDENAFKKAREDLVRIFKNYSDFNISNCNGKLIFISKE